MGVKLRYNLFFGVEAEQVYQEEVAFWAGSGRQVVDRPLPASVAQSAWEDYELYCLDAGWTLLAWDGGWEWTLRRAAQLHVSRALSCAGLLVFVHDGDFWGYELFNGGVTVDQFVGRGDPEPEFWFPGRDCRGQPQLFASHVPTLALAPSDIGANLLPEPDFDDDDARTAWNVPARSGDQYRRGDECAVVDFLRMLGVRIEVQASYVTPLAPLWRAFAVDPPPH
jgi:hypothetical protein